MACCCFSFVFDRLGANAQAPLYVTIATVAARVLSSMCNFLINRSAVFRSTESGSRCLLRYYTLAVVQMLCSAALVSGLVYLTHINSQAVKIPVDAFLFLISFRIQRNWVFRQRRK